METGMIVRTTCILIKSITAEVLDISISALHQWIGDKKQMDQRAAAIAVWGLFRV